MERRPTKCPICGSKITRVTNAVTKNSYFKCSNRTCHFVLGSQFTEEEFYLQGKKLSVSCVKCGESLTIANGPNGLYPRCFSCSCDLEPTSYNGKMYQRWVNAHKLGAKEEIANLVEAFHAQPNEEDELYDFDTYIAASSTMEQPKEVRRPIAGYTLPDKILALLSDVKKPVNSKEISQATGAKATSIRTTLLSLRTLGLVKIVDYIKNRAGNHTLLYQLTESNFPELKVYTKEEGYNTISTFLKENVNKYGSMVRAKETLMKALRESKVKPVLFYSTKGICDGYKTDVMEKLMSPTRKTEETEAKKGTTKKVSNRALYKEYTDRMISTFKENLNKAWTKEEIGAYLGISTASVHRHLDDLTDKRILKIVGWDQDKSYNRILPKYQVMSSPLPKLRVYKSESTSSYATLYGYYTKKLRGKRLVSTRDLYEKMKDAETVVISSSNGYYTGYAVSDLSKAVKELQGVTSPIKKVKRTVKPTELDIETAVALSKVANQEGTSNPLPKKKSIFSTFASFFKKEKNKNILPEQHSVSSK